MDHFYFFISTLKKLDDLGKFDSGVKTGFLDPLLKFVPGEENFCWVQLSSSEVLLFPICVCREQQTVTHARTFLCTLKSAWSEMVDWFFSRIKSLPWFSFLNEMYKKLKYLRKIMKHSYWYEYTKKLFNEKFWLTLLSKEPMIPDLSIFF